MSTVSEAELRVAVDAVDRGDIGVEATLQELCNRYPADARIHFLLGALLERAGRYADSLGALDHALKIDPDHVQALSAKALVLRHLGRPEDAHVLLANAVRRQPDNAQIWTNLGAIHQSQGAFSAALEAYDRALALTDPPLEARMNRGYVLTRLGRPEQALANNQILAGMAPQYADAHFNVAEILLVLNRPAEALEACRAALRIAPGYAKALIDSGLALSQLGQFEQARTAFASARMQDPEAFRNFVNAFDPRPSDDPERFDPEVIFLSRAFARLQDCDWSGRSAYIRQFEAIVRERLASGLGFADASIAYDALTIPVSDPIRLELGRAISSRLKAKAPQFESRGMSRDAGNRRIRVGYLSPDIREHVNAYLLRPLLASHDRTRFEVDCYSTGPADDSKIRKSTRAVADRFVEAFGMSTREIAARIQEDNLDILVDVGGFTAFARPDVLACQVAPIQVGYLGYPGSLGMESVQYRITDRISSPPTQKEAWSEALVYLPDTFFIYDRLERFPEIILSRDEYGLPERAFVFCCFNNYYKIEPEIFSAWMEILKAVPSSLLWLAGRNPAAVGNLRREADVRGVSGERLVFAPFEARERYRARFRLADLFLDTPVFNAMTTACDALAAGLPLLTIAGSAFPSRVAASLLNAVRFPDGITDSLDAYRDRAVHWGRNPAVLRELRKRLLADPLNTPLFDTEGRVRQLEKAYQEMWRRYQAGLAPESFSVVAQPVPAWRSPWH